MAILAVAAVAAETDAEAERLASSMDLNRLRRDRGQYLPLPSPEEALAYPYTDAERASIARNRVAAVRRQPGDRDGKAAAADRRRARPDELMVITAVYDHEARKKSYSCSPRRSGSARRRRRNARRPGKRPGPMTLSGMLRDGLPFVTKITRYRAQRSP